VTFTPGTVGEDQAILTVSDNGENTPSSVALSGTGVLATSSTVLTSSANPSLVRRLVTFTATVTSPVGGTPTGSVTFYDGTTSIATLALARGSAVLSTSSLAPGLHSFTATYGGDSDFAASASGVLTQDVVSRVHDRDDDRRDSDLTDHNERDHDQRDHDR
jgi:hypothetical protein